MFRGNLPCFILCLLPLFLAFNTTKKSLVPSSLHLSFRYFYTLIRSLWSLLFSRLNSPRSLSFSSKELSPFITFMAFFWTLASMSMLLLLRSTDLDLTTLGVASPRLRRGEGSPYFGNTSLNTAQDTIGLLYIRTHCRIMLSLVSTKTSKYFSTKLLSSWAVPSTCQCLGLSLLRYRTLH